MSTLISYIQLNYRPILIFIIYSWTHLILHVKAVVIVISSDYSLFIFYTKICKLINKFSKMFLKVILVKSLNLRGNNNKFNNNINY